MQHHIGQFLTAEQRVAWCEIRPLPLLQSRQKNQIPALSRRSCGSRQGHRLINGRGMRQRIRLNGQQTHLFDERLDGVYREFPA